VRRFGGRRFEKKKGDNRGGCHKLYGGLLLIFIYV